MNRHIMLDLETLGTAAGCSILSIGAVEFGPVGNAGSFYATISRGSCSNAGLLEDVETLMWWTKQSVEARAVLFDTPATMSLGAALVAFSTWFTDPGATAEPVKNIFIWGNGADFDLPILAHAYRAAGQDVPWKPYAGRCYRTLKNLRSEIKLVRSGEHHNAFHDAVSQAEHATRLLNELGGW